MKKLLFILSLLFISSYLYAGTVSFDQLSVSSDLTVSKWNGDMNTIYNKVNTNIDTTNILDDTIDETDMNDGINPRIRTYEGALCEKVDDGLLTTTTVGTLTGSIPAGTAYPRGYRCDKTSSTPKTFVSQDWTFVDIDQSCNFQYSEVAIGAATPAVATNSIRLSRVSTDATQIVSVQDLRTTSCSASTFSISNTTGEATLDDILSVGKDRISADSGFVQGNLLSWDGLTTTFSILSGSAYINGKYRRNTSTTSVPQTADDPSTGTSGLDTGAIAASTKYYVYGVADQSAVKTMSFSISTSTSTPSGITNYRRIGTIRTNANSKFISEDMFTFHAVSQQEVASGWVKFNGSTSPLAIDGSMNVASLTDNGTGDYTVVWDTDFDDDAYVVAGSCWKDAGTLCFETGTVNTTDPYLVGSYRFETVNGATTKHDPPVVTIVAFGDHQ